MDSPPKKINIKKALPTVEEDRAEENNIIVLMSFILGRWCKTFMQCNCACCLWTA
ncbi:MAG: hypothetical protein IJ261_00285 [Clostridia bacterium]|nr:hypothetical protein [Clostridia bacterium]